jgi:hypothetical protein
MNSNVIVLNAAAGDSSGPSRPVGRPKAPEKPKLPAIHVRDVPLAMKDAVTALSKVEIFDENGLCIIARYGSMNNLVLTLMKRGMTSIKDLLDTQTEWKKDKVQSASEIARFFLDNPRSKVVYPKDFPEGSYARKALDEELNDWQQDHEGRDYDYPGTTRQEALDTLAGLQTSLMAMEDAQEALAAAIV